LRERLRLRPLSERAEEHEPEPEERVRHAEGDERSDRWERLGRSGSKVAAGIPPLDRLVTALRTE
jgi:hypothetical protein